MISSAVRPILCIACLCHSFTCGVAAHAGEITVTAFAGADHEFMGFGGSINWSSGGSSEAARKLYSPDEADFRIIRLWASLGDDGNSLYNIYNGRVQDALAQQPELIVLLAPCGRNGSPTSDVSGYAAHYAEMISVARERGMPVHATGIMNEPDDYSRLNADKVTPMVKAFRQELDSRGLQDVILIAPENANVDVGHYEDLQNIMDDQEALDALDGWAYHSYNCSITYIMREMTAGTGKTVWNTESCVDEQTTVEGGSNSAQIAVNAAAKVLADLTMGATHWVYFFSYRNGDDGTMLLATNGGEKRRRKTPVHLHAPHRRGVPRRREASLLPQRQAPSPRRDDMGVPAETCDHGGRCAKSRQELGNRPVQCDRSAEQDERYCSVLSGRTLRCHRAR